MTTDDLGLFIARKGVSNLLATDEGTQLVEQYLQEKQYIAGEQESEIEMERRTR